MDFNLTLCIIFFVLMFFAVPIVCYLFCSNEILHKLRNLLLAFYVLVLLIGVTGHIVFDGNVVHVDYSFTKEWGNKDMSWGFDELSWIDFALNILMLIPIGAFIASGQKKRKVWQTIILSCLVGMLVSLGIETLQYILPVNRSVQFSDTLFNTVSAGLGAIMILAFINLRPKVQNWINKKQEKKSATTQEENLDN
ncbi:MAG: VanZ family protein [Clostridia bacterium]|nr:VanZ family protein [Clostridia bacterium]